MILDAPLCQFICSGYQNDPLTSRPAGLLLSQFLDRNLGFRMQKSLKLLGHEDLGIQREFTLRRLGGEFACILSGPCFQFEHGATQAARTLSSQIAVGRVKFCRLRGIQLSLAVAVGSAMTFLHDAELLPAQGARSDFMSKLLILSAALTMVGGVSSIASAQCGCCGTQSYQRYSYQPSAVSQVQAMQSSQTLVPSQASNGNIGNAAVVQPPAGVAQSQSYRRYSYQPQPTYQSYQAYQPQPTYRSQTNGNYSASPRKNPWEYAKGERQRYLP